MITKERLAEIKARTHAASEGPWEHDEGGLIEVVKPDGSSGGAVAYIHPHGNLRTVMKYNSPFSVPDAEFICHARTDVPELVTTLDEACALLNDLYARFACAKCATWEPKIKPSCTCGYAAVSNFLDRVGAP